MICLVRDSRSHHRRTLERKKVECTNHGFLGDNNDLDRLCVHRRAVLCSPLLLRFAESRFFPGILVYLTHWFRLRERSRAITCLYTANPAVSLIGSPLDGWLLGVHWRFLAGWRWLARKKSSTAFSAVAYAGCSPAEDLLQLNLPIGRPAVLTSSLQLVRG